MIQLKKKLASPAPVKLATDGKIAIEDLKTKYNSGQRDFEFNTGLYGHAQVKNLLLVLQDGKCCFCESKITAISYGDVEHFRPKKAWVQINEPLNKPGYYWLAYEWSNLFLSCQICNQQYKKNYFPLADNAQRAKSHNDNIGQEEPLFIDPALENPESFIGFNEEIPFAIDSNNRGIVTIDKTGLKREALNESRRSKLNPIRDLYNLAKGIPDTSPAIRNEAWQFVKRFFDESQLDDTEYAFMLRSFFKANPLPL